MDQAGTEIETAGTETETAGTEIETAGTETETAGTETETAGTETETAGTETETAGTEITEEYGNSQVGTGTYPSGANQLILSNAPLPCEQISAIAPYLPDEAGHHAASVLTPSAYPFTVSMIEYTLEEPPDISTCNSSLAHRLEISVLAADQALPTSPQTEAVQFISLDIPSSIMDTERRVILQNLTEPIVLSEGERLMVSVSLEAVNAEHLCIAVCEDEMALANLELWSNRPNTPYDWISMSEFGINSEFLIKAIGNTANE